jgi:hemolysin III
MATTFSTAPTRPPVPGSPAVAPPLRPSWRGLIHRVAVLVFVPVSAGLVLLATVAADRAAVAVWALGVATMLGVSATYHSGRFGPVALRRLKRVDHSTILLAIAGSYTAVATLALDGPAQARLLAFVWVGAVVGMVIRLTWLHAPYPVVALVYVVVGWGALLEWRSLAQGLSTTQFALILGGGLLYTIGAGVYAAHRPNPWPATFGYHEVFHALVVGGVTLHLVAIATLVTQS